MRKNNRASQPAEVEKFKIDPELMKLSKAYGKQAKISKKLQEGIKVRVSELQQLKRALFGVEEQKEMLLRKAKPGEKMLDGQPGPEIDLSINY